MKNLFKNNSIKIFCMTVLAALSVAVKGNEEKLNVTQTIVYNVSEKNNSLIFILKNNEKAKLYIDKFARNKNSVNLINKQQRDVGFLVSGGSYIIFPSNSNILWTYDEIFLTRLWNDFSQQKRINNNFIALDWNFSSPWSRKLGTKSHIYLCKSLDKAKSSDFITKLDEKNALNLKIAKVMDGKKLDFALIMSNNTKHTVVVPDFFGEKSSVKLKLSTGDEFSYHDRAKDKSYLTLKTGESKFIKVNLKELFKKHGLELDDFNGGLSKLVWELKISDKTTLKTRFNLMKLDKELPIKVRSLGIFIDDVENFEIPEEPVYPKTLYWQKIREIMKKKQKK